MAVTPGGSGDPVAIRIFTIDESSGNAIPGVGLRVAAVFGSGQEQALTTLMTDAHGFASAKLDLSPFPGVSAVKVTPSGGQGVRVSVADLQQGLDLYRIGVSAATTALSSANAVPSVLDPDPRDALLSPASIGMTPQLGAPGGLCAQLTPTPMPVRRFRTFQVKADICKVITLECPQQKVDIVLGQILEYEVAWHPLGTSLGQLLHTITLAPCEQVTVAISDWIRRENALREDATLIEQQTAQHIEHDRLIMESLNSDVTSKSLSLAAARTLGVSIPIKEKINVTAAESIGASLGWSNQQIATNTTNNLAERIDQAATLVMSQRSTVVFQATVSEQRIFQTQTLRNNNQCHTLTKVFYQVNEGFRVVTRYVGERNAILVRYPNDDFDARRAFCNAAVLRPALLDPSLDKCFDELTDALFCCDEKAGADVRMDSVTLTATVQSNSSTSTLTLLLWTANGVIQLPTISISGWQSGQTHTQMFPLGAPIDPAIVHTVTITVSGSSSFHTLILSQLQLTYHAAGVPNPLALFSSQSPIIISLGWSAEVKAEIPPAVAGTTPCVEKSCSAQKLLGHLNCAGNKRFYNSLVWLSEDSNERVMRWSCCAGQDLIGSIENTPLAVYGDFVAFPAGPLVPNTSVPPTSKLVFLPTPGVYSEGILGQCNTCEIIDPNRFTDWKCPDIPAAPDLGSPQSGTTAGALKPEGITNQITLSSIPSAPDSILKTLLDTLLASAKSDSQSQALLEKLFDLLKETLSKTPTSGSTASGGSGGG
jgi:hypothetical protein